MLKVMASFFLVLGNQALASSGSQSLNFYEMLANLLAVDSFYLPAFSAVLSVPVLFLFGVLYKSLVSGALKAGEVSPSKRMGFFVGLDMLLGFLYGLAKENCGKGFLRFFPLIATLFMFILINNLSGMVPGFTPSTGNFSMNLALGAIVFLIYNWEGIKEHKFAYIKQFSGPFLVLAPFFLVLELASHCSRPLSLAFRLTANIFGDHLLLAVFNGLVPLLLPIVFMFFGLLVACVQSFVFTLLTAVYISMAVSHDH